VHVVYLRELGNPAFSRMGKSFGLWVLQEGLGGDGGIQRRL
jgi:hypothetical protein